MKIFIKKLKYNLLKNDLLEASSSLTPEIPGILKLFSKKINKCKYYNITGSGSACFGIFGDKKSLLNARKTFKRKYRNYWTASVKTIKVVLLLGLSQSGKATVFGTVILGSDPRAPAK